MPDVRPDREQYADELRNDPFYLPGVDDYASDEPVCGESYDHTLKLVGERDGWSTYECTECGAEITEGPED